MKAFLTRRKSLPVAASAALAMSLSACGSITGSNPTVVEKPTFAADTTRAQFSSDEEITIGSKFGQPLFGQKGFDVGLDVTAGGWREVFVENFDVPVALGDFPGPEYADRWMSYDGFEDTSGIGLYKPSEVLSVHDGSLDMYLHTKAGRPLGAAPVPLINGEWRGHLYGRYTVRFKTDALEGFGAGWLLWPDSNDWNEGEIDFPEGGLDATIQANQHCIGDPEEKCLAVDTGVEFSDGWHTTMIEWTPSGVVYYLDGRVVGTSPESPSTPMHLVLQTGTNGVKPHASVAGHVLIDSVTISAWG
jgi:hypothetical protein